MSPSSKKKVKVDVAIACAPNQIPKWWQHVMREIVRTDRLDYIEIGEIRALASALPAWAKNKQVGQNWQPKTVTLDAPDGRRDGRTDVNRSNLTDGFLAGDADYIWWLDDDTIPPRGTLPALLALDRDIAAGLYFIGYHPHHPIAYNQRPDGLYEALETYNHNSLFQVDAVGMGCTLIKRDVYERIAAEYTEFMRPDGSLLVMKNDKIKHFSRKRPEEAQVVYTKEGPVLDMPLIEKYADDDRPFPFYAMEYGRTEDLYFCELAKSAGVEIWLDTSIVCEHVKPHGVGRAEYKASRAKIEKEQANVLD